MGCLNDFLSGGRARIVGLRGDNAFGQREKNLAHLGDGFVTHGAKNKNQAAIFITARKRGAQGPSSGGIVGHVENIFGSGISRRDDLEPARPTSFANSLLDRFGSDGESLFTQFFHGPYRQSDVTELMASDKRGLDKDLF